jgi:hypothetical protein
MTISRSVKGLTRRAERGVVVCLIELAGIVVAHKRGLLVTFENTTECRIHGGAIKVGEFGA